MKAPDFIFRLDRHRRFLSGPSLALDQILWADCPASDCADRPLSGRDFASPATSSVNHSRGNLTARVSGIQSKENSWKMKMNAATVFRNRSLDFRKSVAPQYVHGFAGLRNSKGRPVPRRPRRLAGLAARC